MPHFYAFVNIKIARSERNGQFHLSLILRQLLGFRFFPIFHQEKYQNSTENHSFRNADDPPGEGLVFRKANCAGQGIRLVSFAAGAGMDMDAALMVIDVVMGQHRSQFKAADGAVLGGAGGSGRAG